MMPLNEAWATLGKNPNDVFNSIKSQKDLETKKLFVQQLLTKAKSIAKKLMAQSHPDRNPNDEDAVDRFKRIQQALEVIEQSISDFIKKIEQKKSQNIDNDSESCYIDIKI